MAMRWRGSVDHVEEDAHQERRSYLVRMSGDMRGKPAIRTKRLVAVYLKQVDSRSGVLAK